MSISRLAHEYCPFFSVYIEVRKVNNLVQTWKVNLKVDRSRWGLYFFKGYQVVLADEGTIDWEEERKILTEFLLICGILGGGTISTARFAPLRKIKSFAKVLTLIVTLKKKTSLMRIVGFHCPAQVTTI